MPESKSKSKSSAAKAVSEAPTPEVAKELDIPEDLISAQDRATKNLEVDAPTTTAGQVHPAVGNPSPVTQEGRDIRDGSQHINALLRFFADSEELSDIQKQKLESHPAAKQLLEDAAAGRDVPALVQQMAAAKTDVERQAVLARAALPSPSAVVALLREPEDPNADPVRDRSAPPQYRVAEVAS